MIDIILKIKVIRGIWIYGKKFRIFRCLLFCGETSTLKNEEYSTDKYNKYQNKYETIYKPYGTPSDTYLIHFLRKK